MNEFDQFPAAPDGSGGDLQPYSPSSPLAPSAPPEFGQVDYWVDPTGDSPRSKPIATGVARIFGVEVPGVSVRDLQVNLVQPIADLFKREMISRGVNKRHVELAANWYVQNCQKMPIAEHKYHNYDLRGFDISIEDRAPITAFCNFCDEHGIDGNTVRLFLSWNYRALPAILEQYFRQSQSQPSVPSRNANYSLIDELSDADFDRVQKRAESDMHACQSVLQTHWGQQYEENLARTVKFLSKQDKAFLNSAVAKDGVILANSPEVWLQLYRSAIGAEKPSDDIDKEISELESVMKNDRARYNKDLALQERLRFLYGQRGY